MNPSLKNTLTSPQGDRIYRRIGPNADIDKPIMGLYINTMNNIECILLNFHIHPYIVIYHISYILQKFGSDFFSPK